MDQEAKMQLKEKVERFRELVLERISEAEQLIQDLEDSEPENCESLAYERWQDKLDEAEDWSERCYKSWDKLKVLAEQYDLGYKEDDWIA